MAICVTSIHEPKSAFIQYRAIYESPIYWVGDRKSPAITTNAVRSITLQDQLKIEDLTLPGLLPIDHYSRKNIGYLLALQDGADWILDTDDDNFPRVPYEPFPSDTCDCTVLTGSKGRVNIYKYFTDHNVWPRGLGYQFDEAQPVSTDATSDSVAVWQGLADGDPDVDAIYRLAGLGEVSFDSGPIIALDQGLYCPFNSQNTMWKARYLSYAYLPSTVTFRFTDILRGYVAQRGLWAHDCRLGFVGPNVFQDRNEHDLLKDLESELIMYKSIDRLVSILEELTLTACETDNLLVMYDALASAGIVQANELEILAAWLDDVAYVARG